MRRVFELDGKENRADVNVRERIKGLVGRVESTVRLRYLGIGFIWAWLYCSYETSALFSHRQGISINADGSWLVSAVTVILAFFVGGFLLRRQNVKPLFPVFASIALSVGTVLSVVGSMGNGSALLAGGFLTGVGYAFASILWVMVLLPVDLEELEVIIPFSTLVMAVCSLIVPALQGVAAVVGTAVLPLASSACLLACIGGGTESGSSVADGRFRGAWVLYLLRVSFLLCVVYLIIGCEAALFSPGDAGASRVGLTSLASNCATVVFAILLVLYSKRVSFSGLFRWVMPLLVISLVLVGISGDWAQLATGLINSVCDSLIEVLLFLFVLTIAKNYGAPVTLGLGMVCGFSQAGVLLGNLLGRACAISGVQATNSFLSPDQLSMALICILAIAMLFVPQKDLAGQVPRLSETDSADQSLARACLEMQRRYGLSDREAEVAALLAKGRSRPYIRERLFISTNTVATHIKHIYQKLDIHSKEELIDMANDLMESSAPKGQ